MIIKEFIEKKVTDYLVAEVDGYTLFKENRGKKGLEYTIYDPDMNLIGTMQTFNDTDKFKNNLDKSPVYKRFLEIVDANRLDSVESSNDSDYDEDDVDYDYTRQTGFNYPKNTIKSTGSAWKSSNHKSHYMDYDDDDDYFASLGIGSYWRNGGYHYQAPPRKTGFFPDYTKSDTLVFHKDDPTTRMLCQIYEGKGWDVITGTSDLDTAELHRVVDAHKRIVCLGHGHGYGLMGMFGTEMAPHFKNKNLFVIWCNADTYFKNAKIGYGQFITGNMPSEVWECSGAGCGSISTKLMLDNITYWSKLCADVVEDCLHGKVKESVEYIRKNYLEKYGNHPVTIYNSIRTTALGENIPLPKYEFKGQPLEGEDKPVPFFDEKAFLENPTPSAAKCPTFPHEEPAKPAFTPTNYYTSYFKSNDPELSQYNKDYKDKIHPFFDELAKTKKPEEFFADDSSIDDMADDFGAKAHEKYPEVKLGDCIDMFYWDWLPVYQDTYKNQDKKELINKLTAYWKTLLPNYTQNDFLRSKYITIKNEILQKTLQEYPNDKSKTNMTDVQYKEGLSDVYDEWANHLDGAWFKKQD